MTVGREYVRWIEHHSLPCGEPNKGEGVRVVIVSKNDLAAEVGRHSGLGSGEAKLAVEKVFELIAGRLAAGDEVNVSGFGKFSVTARAARQGRNPQTGETIEIAPSNALKFSAASALKSAVNA